MTKVDPLDATIRDQREMIGTTRHGSVEEVEAAWRAWAEDPTHVLATRLRRGDPSRELRTSRKVVQAYISGGKWIADCPECNGGIACWLDNPRGCCLDCGTIYRVDHPKRAEAKRAIKLLAERPDPLTRSWHRHKGETVAELEAENEQHLVAAADAAAAYAEEAPLAEGVVAASDIVRLLGHRALDRLKAEGVL